MKKKMINRCFALLTSTMMMLSVTSGIVLAEETEMTENNVSIVDEAEVTEDNVSIIDESEITDETKQPEEILPQESEPSDISEQPKAPGLRSAASMRVNASEINVHGANPVNIRAQWLETSALPGKVTITVSNGGKVLAKTASDITFSSNGGLNTSPVTDLQINEDGTVMTFMTGTNKAVTNSAVEFQVEAPLGNRSFEVKVQVGVDKETIANTASVKLNVISGLSVEVKDNQGIEIYDVDDYNPIYLTGMAWYKGSDAPDPSYIFVEITNKETGEPVNEYLEVIDIVDREFNFGPFYMPSTYDDGLYEVTVYMITDGDEPGLLGLSKTEFSFKKLPDVYQVAIYNQWKNIRAASKPFSGESVLYDYLWVRPVTFEVSNDAWHGNCNISASVEFKNAKDIVSSKFIVHTSFGIYEFNGNKSGNLVYAYLNTFRTDAYINEDGVLRRPYITCVTTKKDGSSETTYIGEIKVALDPSGQVCDGITEKPIEGVTCTLFVKDEEANEWILWVDDTNQQQNPVVTGNDGKYGWDVQPGKYEVRMYHPDYFDSDKLFYSTLLDDRYGELCVPPEQTNIDIMLFKQTGGVARRLVSAALPENTAINFIPAYQSEIDEAIRNNTPLVIKVAGEAKALYLTKTQVTSILDAGIDLVVIHGAQQKTISQAEMQTQAEGIRTNICFLL